LGASVDLFKKRKTKEQEKGKDGLLNEGTWMHVWNYGVHV